ncbi:MAG TPA: hypothetical protein VFE53_20025 [Mucilaginibacter sp.]|jgi:hypothetical protein|nr:hypothetical protein [Mucilaginibacter sp.]
MKFPGLLLFLVICSFVQPRHNKVVQFNINPILNARPVSTFNGGNPVTWKTGIDGGGNGDGYLTKAAAAFIMDPVDHALPDDPRFAGNDAHPEIRLHYSNDDSLHYQACAMRGETSITFSVPKGKYSMLYFALTSAEGGSPIKFDLTYANGDQITEILLPDYYQDIPANDANLCYLLHDLAKWGPANKMTERNHHNIDLVKVQTDPKRTLLKIKISKGKTGYVVFWAAAGVLHLVSE